MGDFAGAVLKYVRRHPVDRLTICGGFAKLSKLAAGHLDLHSARSQVDKGFLAELARRGRRGRGAGRRGRRRQHGPRRAPVVHGGRGARWATWWRRRPATRRWRVLRGAPVAVDVICIDRAGTVVGRSTVG